MPGAKRRAVREGGSFLSRLTTRTSPAMCPPPGPLDPGAGLKVGVPGLACHVPNGRLAHRAGSTVVVAARVTRTERAAYSEAQAHRTRGPGEPVEARVADMFAVRELETDVRDALGPGYSSLNWID